MLSIISTTTLFSQTTTNPLTPELICSNQSITNGVHQEALTGVSVRSVCETGYTTRMRFILVQIRSGSTFTFQITPSSGANFDYDFLSWKNPPLDIYDLDNITPAMINALPQADRGNRNTGGQGRTVGLRLNAPTLCRGVEGDGLERHYDVVPGDIILIGIDKFGTGSESYNLEFGGDSVLDCYLGKSFFECVDEQTGLATFNLASITDEIRPPNDNSPVFFYRTEAEANAHSGQNLVDNIVSIPYTEEGMEVFASFVHENSLGERQISVVKFILRPLAKLNVTTETLYGCYQGTNPMTGAVLGLFNLKDLIPEEYNSNTLIKKKIYKTREQAEANGADGLIPENTWVDYYSVASTFYVRLEYNVGNESKCARIIPVRLEIVRVQIAQDEVNAQVCYGETIDLTRYQTQFITVTDEYNYKYYFGNVEITDPAHFTVTESSQIRIEIGKGKCIETVTLNIQMEESPYIEFWSEFSMCDNNLDGLYEVDLTEINSFLLDNTGDYQYVYYTSLEDGTNQTNGITGNVALIAPGQKLYVRANSAGRCYTLVEVPLLARETVAFTQTTIVLEECIDLEGNSTYDLSEVIPSLALEANVTYKYYPTLADAGNLTNEILNPTTWQTASREGTIFIRLSQAGKCDGVASVNFRAISQPAIQTEQSAVICQGEEYILDLSIYENYSFTLSGTATEIRNKVYSLTEGGQYDIIVSTATGCQTLFNFELIVNPLPQFTAITEFGVCDSNLDGTFELDLNALTAAALVNDENITLSFYATEADLLAGINEIIGDEYLTRLPASIWLKAVSGNGCFVYKSIQLVSGNGIQVNPVRNVLQGCIDLNGITEFDLTTARNQFNVPDGYILSYYRSLNDLQNGRNEILNPTVWTTTERAGIVYVKFEAAGLCPSFSTLEFISNDLPAIDIQNRYFICADEEFVLDLSQYTYTIQVTGENVVNLGGNKFRLSRLGDYGVLVTNEFGCSSAYTFTLATFDTPVIQEIIVSSSSIIVNLVSNVDYVNVQYSLDGINFQDSNVLLVPQRGVNYDIYVKIGNCIFFIQNIQVIDIPTFFSPNNDGINDIWRVRPLSIDQPGNLKIFDRFGKTLYEQKLTQEIYWDGKIAGKPLPSTDYWYTIDVEGVDYVKTIKYTGSITLKNKE